MIVMLKLIINVKELEMRIAENVVLLLEEELQN